MSKGVQADKSSDGAFIENVEIEEATQRLAQLSETLQTSMVPDQGGVLSDTEHQLATICKSCVSVSTELIIYLDKLKVPNCAATPEMNKFRKALESVWSAADLYILHCSILGAYDRVSLCVFCRARPRGLVAFLKTSKLQVSTTLEKTSFDV